MASFKRTAREQDPPDPEQPHHAPELERRFLRLGVEEMAAQRAACARCGRSPLVGERLRVFARPDGRQRPVCDLCVAELPRGALGEQVSVMRVGASERRLNVVRAA
jgi:hypothetical protein